MFCGNCGTKLVKGKCPKCDKKVEKKTEKVKAEKVETKKTTVVNEKANFAWAVLGFCIPVVGLILFIVFMNKRKDLSKKAGIGALIGFVKNVIVILLCYFLTFYSVFSIVNYITNYIPTYPIDDPEPWDDIIEDDAEDDEDDEDSETIISEIDTSKSLSQYNFISDSLQVIEENKEYDVHDQGFKLLLKNGTLNLVDDVTGEVYDTINNVTKAYYHKVDCSGWDSIVVYSGNDVYYANPHDFSYLNVKLKKLSGKYNSLYIIRNLVWTCGGGSITVGTTDTAKGDIVLYDLNTETIFAKDTYNFYESNTKFIRTSRGFQFDSISGSAKLVIKSSVSDEVLGVINFIDTGYDLTNVQNPKLGKVTKVTVKGDVTTLYMEDGTTAKFEYSEIEY